MELYRTEIWVNRFGLDDSLYISQLARRVVVGERRVGQMLSSALRRYLPQVA